MPELAERTHWLSCLPEGSARQSRNAAAPPGRHGHAILLNIWQDKWRTKLEEPGMTALSSGGPPVRSNGIRDRPSAAFGPTLRQYRIKAGFTQEELANRSGISIRAISDMERNRTTKPLMRSARMLADALTLSGDARDEFAEAAIRCGAEPPFMVRHGLEPASVDDCIRLPGSPSWTAVPRQLPASVRDFAGRQRELAALGGFLDEGITSGRPMPIVVIGGIAGAGKTALAVRWARDEAARFPDGQLYVDLDGFSAAESPLPVADALDGFLHALAIPPRKRPCLVADKAAMYRSIVAGRRMLILLDNACHAAHVRPLLPGSDACLTLVTSRDVLTGLAATHGALLINLDMLGAEAAHEYLAGRIGAERITAEMHATRELIELCAGLPLALSIAAAHAAARPGTPLAAFAAGLRARPDRLDALDAGDPACDVRSVISWSYNRLDRQAARMFRLLGLHPGPDIGVEAAASLADIRPTDTRRLCDQLIRAGLLRESGERRYVGHELLRAYAAELADAAEENAVAGLAPDYRRPSSLLPTCSSTDRVAAVGRCLDYYLHAAHAASKLVDPEMQLNTLAPARPGTVTESFADRGSARSWLAAEQLVLQAVTVQAAELGFHFHAGQLRDVLASRGAPY